MDTTDRAVAAEPTLPKPDERDEPAATPAAPPPDAARFAMSETSSMLSGVGSAAVVLLIGRFL
jgi:hypothetical protein